MTKKLVLMDQSALSNMVRVVHPRLRRASPHSDFHRKLMIALERLVHLQAVVCPEVGTHDEESVLDRRLEAALRVVLRRYSGGHGLAHWRTIEILQTVDAALAWLAGGSFRLDATHVERVVPASIHSWLPGIDTVAESRWTHEDIDALRSIRVDTVSQWQPTFDRWRSNRLDFMDRFREEGMSYGITALRLTAERQRRIQEMQAGKQPFNPRDVATGSVDPVLKVLHALAETGLGEAASRHTLAFFQSPTLLDVPFIRLSAMLFASLSIETQQGRKGPTDKDLGTPADFRAISTSLPYCDAMFVDNKCAQYLGQGMLANEVKKYHCRVFSLRTQDQFLDYLAALEASVPPAQRELAEEIYGPLPTEIPNLFASDEDAGNDASATT